MESICGSDRQLGSRGPWRHKSALRRGPLGLPMTNPAGNMFTHPLCFTLETVHAADPLLLPPPAGQFQRSKAPHDGCQVCWPGEWVPSMTAFIPQQCFSSKCYRFSCPALRSNADVCIFFPYIPISLLLNISILATERVPMSGAFRCTFRLPLEPFLTGVGRETVCCFWGIKLHQRLTGTWCLFKGELTPNVTNTYCFRMSSDGIFDMMEHLYWTAELQLC